MHLVRILTVDFYMSYPIQGLDVTYSDYRGSSIQQVPIIRIFGSSEEGFKTCLHIHGVFPYVYIPFEGSENPSSRMYQIATKLDQTINTALGQTSSNTQHVYKIVHVSGIPFYGYHPGDHQFLKIYFYNPLVMKKATNLLQNGNILSNIYQLHEAHIPFVLQFMIDYNLHGMNYISLSEVRYRKDSGTIPYDISPEFILPAAISKTSTCLVEIDGLCEHIVNRLEITAGRVAKNPGISALWDDEKQRRRMKNETSMISQCLSQTRTNVPPTDSHNYFRDALKGRLSSLRATASQTQDAQNLSVYPAETPKAKTMVTASFVDNHSFSAHSTNSSSSSNSTTLVENTPDYYSNENITLLNETLSETFNLNDSDANELLEVLYDLGNNVNVEKDSLLSQVTNYEEEESEEENDINMSLPLGNTPSKIVENEISNDHFSENATEASPTCDIVLNEAKLELDRNIIVAENAANNANMRDGKDKLATISHVFSSMHHDADSPNKTVESQSIERAKRQLGFGQMASSQSRHEEKLKPNNITKNVIFYGDLKPTTSTNTNSTNSSEASQNVFSQLFEQEVCTRSSEDLFSDDTDMDIGSSAEINLNSKEICNRVDIFTSPHSSDDGVVDCTKMLPHSSNTYSESLVTANQNLHFEPISDSCVDLKQIKSHGSFLVPKFNPPSKEMIKSTMEEYGIPLKKFKTPFYSNLADVTSDVQIGHRVLKIEGATSNLSEFECFNGYKALLKLRTDQIQLMYPGIQLTNSNIKRIKLSYFNENRCIVRTSKLPPTRTEVLLWLQSNKSIKKTKSFTDSKEKLAILIPCSPGVQSEDETYLSPFSPIIDEPLKIAADKTNELDNKNIQPRYSEDSCQITGATMNNTYGFKASLDDLQQAKALSDHQCLTTIVLELHIKTRVEFKPNPELDAIRAIFYSVANDVPETSPQYLRTTGMIAVDIFNDPSSAIIHSKDDAYEILWVDSENSLIDEFIKLIRIWDPDIFSGYEIEQLSWGYLVERGYILGFNLLSSLARTELKFTSTEEESELKLTGRVVLDVWRLMRHEIALQSYSFENVMFHVLHVRLPLYSFKDLSFWWEHKSGRFRQRTFKFYITKVEGVLKLFNQLDLIGRTCELARLFGIQFYEVLSRGSQFRVESMMLRLAKPLNYVAVSPSVQQRAKMKAPESLPLILEPESKFYTDPVIVLDFQSLYPSIIIAYNYCFSTCLGKVEYLGQNIPFAFGATQLKIPLDKLNELARKNCLTFSPSGVAFVKSKIRKGILPRMLLEILDTRLMVKKSMKQNKNDKVLQKVLHSRQLGLKLIANVTYGYTAANFSGRMPAVEVADSIVSKGRETLLRAIKLIENTPRWQAKVVYGDTDSVFVLVRGRSRATAFEIGAEIADAVTNDNPSPVKLKLEKVYHPCILQTKKRYVGYMYETPDQVEPEFCAKGIETVRRDGCPASSKMLEKSLKILFDTCDISMVREYVVRQFSKLISGKVSLQDLIFAKEYRGAASYRPNACVPVLELTKKWLANDKRSEPRSGERVPYVIVNGPPGLPLIKLVRSPRELLSNSNLLPNVLYYITRAIIPPLNRCFMLVGVDVQAWFNTMPRKQMNSKAVTPNSRTMKGAISNYFSTTKCLTCTRQTQQGICMECCKCPQEPVVILQSKIRCLERAYYDGKQICDSCCGYSTNDQCISLDCPIMFSISRARVDLEQIPYIRKTASSALNIEF